MAGRLEFESHGTVALQVGHDAEMRMQPAALAQIEPLQHASLVPSDTSWRQPDAEAAQR